MIKIKTPEDIILLRESGRRLALVLAELEKVVAPGIKTSELDDLARDLIKKTGDQPAFLNYRPHGSVLAFPAALCVSVNDEIVHGVPGPKVLQTGDIVGLDLGLNHRGRFTDMAATVPVGKISSEAQKMITAAREALNQGVEACRPGQTIGDIGWAIEKTVKSFGFSVINDLTGHGVGLAVHEDPLIPNFGRPGMGATLKPGMVLALEPMITLGTGDIKLGRDGFTFKTKNGNISTHFEHTVLITDNEPEILTKL